MNQLTTRLARICGVVGAVSLLLLLGYVVVSVATRYLVATPLPAVAEFTSRWGMVPLVYAGWVLAQSSGEHIRVDLVTKSLSARVQQVVHMVVSLLTAGFLGLVGWFGLLAANDSMQRGEYGVDSGLPVWPTRYVIPVLAAAMLGVVLSQLRTPVTDLAGDGPGHRDE